MRHLFTSESVTEGHPDKVCDLVADRILDALLRGDEFSRCACEVTAERGALHIMGEITSRAKVDYETVARDTIREIGYDNPEYGFDADSCHITCFLHEQSPDIAQGVDSALESREAGSKDIGAGDQGMMFGYACDETEQLMPLPITLAHALTRRLAAVRRDKTLAYLRPDGKAQVTVEYDGGKPLRVDTVVVSAQHDPDVDMEQLRRDIKNCVVMEAIPRILMDDNTKFYINPTGRFVLGGPAADTGLTGRKIIADTYGGSAAHGGGSFSGKDSTKVDRSATYMARAVAKTIVAAGAASRCEVELSYAIGVAQPVSVYVDTRGTGVLSDEELCGWIRGAYDLRPAAIIDTLRLRRPIFFETTNYGHFGRSGDAFVWEQPDEKALASLKKLLADKAKLA